MFLLFENGLLDLDHDLLVELLEVVDRQIERVEAEISRSPSPDSLGHFDRMEAVIGLGFVACQRYINATYPQLLSTRLEALQASPKLSGGRSVTEVINAAANFWKHSDEWPRPNRKDEERTRAVIDSLVPSSSDYVMANVLCELLQPHPPRFASLVQILAQWRDLLIVARA